MEYLLQLSSKEGYKKRVMMLAVFALKTSATMIPQLCQRSSQCPMCWQPISLKDPTSQGLLEAVEQERSFRFNRSRNATIFHHPALGDFELQHMQLPAGENDAELEERIIQHLADLIFDFLIIHEF